MIFDILAQDLIIKFKPIIPTELSTEQLVILKIMRVQEVDGIKMLITTNLNLFYI